MQKTKPFTKHTQIAQNIYNNLTHTRKRNIHTHTQIVQAHTQNVQQRNNNTKKRTQP